MESIRRTFQRSGWLGIVATALLRCAELDAAESARVDAAIPDSTVLLAGDINEAMLERFNQAINEHHATTVMIESAGGDERISLRIAQAMQVRHMDVVVRRLCLSKCAQYIFIAGRNRRVEDQSLVAFGNSLTGLEALFDSVGDNVPPDFRPDATWRDFALAERKLYEQAGVSASFALNVQLALQPDCVVFRRNAGKTDGVRISTGYTQWVPTQAYLASAGIRVDGYWPTSRRQVTRIVARLSAPDIKDEFNKQVRFATENSVKSSGEAAFLLKKLQTCALEEVGRPDEALDGTAPAN